MLSIIPTKMKEEKTHLRNLVIMAKADNHLDLKEINCIYKIGRRIGLSERQIEETLHASRKEPYVAPTDVNEKYSQLYDLIDVMMSDGVIDDKESKFCSEIATQMGFRSVVSQVLITKICRCLELGHSKERIFNEVQPFLV